MLISDIVGFRREVFFEGAVQLGWLEKDRARAQAAAASYVFHGPEFHAVSASDHGEHRESALEDTATFFQKLVRLTRGDQGGSHHNPFGLAIAGYGTGKSHLGVTLARALGGEPAEREAILGRLTAVAPELGEACREDLQGRRPVLVVGLDGMGDFHLGSELYRKLVGSLQAHHLDLGPLDELSPRFKMAAAFVERNFALRKPAFDEALGEDTQEQGLCERLVQRDERAFAAVNRVYLDANGAPIGAAGQESPEELITTVCEHYCGPDKPFASLLILFDEFGRYLEFAADKPHVAGDSALQQVFQGVQTAGAQGRAYFLGLIQYELKTYLAQLEKRDARHLLRFVPRFDQAEKTLLSSNLETLFANLIERRDPAALDGLVGIEAATKHWRSTHALMQACLRNFGRWEVWSDYERFRQVIVRGCWPLHPTTVWLLARLSNLVQSRSALSFVEAAIARVASEPALTPAGLPACVYPVDMLLTDMFGEILDAEKRTHGSIAEAFAAIRERHAGRWTREQERALAAIVAAQKMQAQATSRASANEFLGALAGQDAEGFARCIKAVIETYGVAEWNEDLQQYDLVIDAVPRSHFALFLRKKAAAFGETRTLDHFRQYGKTACGLADIEIPFAKGHDISTSDWGFEIACSTPATLQDDLAAATKRWLAANAPDDPKGQLLYLLAPQATQPEALAQQAEAELTALLASRGRGTAPILCVILHDEDGELIDRLASLAVLERHLDAEDHARYQHFIEPEQGALHERLVQLAEQQVKQRRFAFAPNVRVAPNRLRLVGAGVFKAAYPGVLTFPFDGFATTRGNAVKDCAAITRAIAGRQLDGNWLATQQPQTQNRARTLLVGAWQVLGEDLYPRARAGYRPLADLLDALEARLEAEEELDLQALFLDLIAPPVGCNAASAMLIIALFLSADRPLKTLVQAGEPIGREAWLQKVYHGKQLVEPARLKGSVVRLVPATAAGEWQQLCNRWFCETTLRGKLAHAAEAAELEKLYPVPDDYQEHVDSMRRELPRVAQQLEAFDAKRDDWAKQLERVTRAPEFGQALVVAGRVATEQSHFKQQAGLWADEDRAQLAALLEACRMQARMHFDGWLALQHPTALDDLPEFQEGCRRQATALEKLGLFEERKRLTQQASQATERMKQRVEHEVTLREARRFLEASIPTSATTAGLLAEWSGEAKRRHEPLAELQRVEPSVADLASELQARVSELESRLAILRGRLQALLERPLVRYSDVREAQDEARRLVGLWEASTSDGTLVDELVSQLAMVLEDWEPLQAFEGDRDSLSKLVAQRLDARVAAPSASALPYWDYDALYASLLAEAGEAMAARGTRWLESVAPGDAGWHGWSAARCKEVASRLEEAPAYLDSGARLRGNALREALELRARELEAVAQRERASAWMAEHVPPREAVMGFGLEQCRAALKKLDQGLDDLDAPELEQVAEARVHLQHRWDDLDFVQLAERARRLPADKRSLLAAMLHEEPSRL